MLITDHHPGYIDWPTYEDNLARIGSNLRRLLEICPRIDGIAESGANPSAVQVGTSDDLRLLRVVETAACRRDVRGDVFVGRHLRIDALGGATIAVQSEVAFYDLQVEVIFVSRVDETLFHFS